MARPPRLDQSLSRFGYCSRREAAGFIKAGRVCRGTLILRDPEERIEQVELLVDGQPIPFIERLLIVVNKPLGLVCSHDEKEGPAIYDILPEQWRRRDPQVSSIGRLDKDTSGLILITDDGVLNHRLCSPKHHEAKIYELETDRAIPVSSIELFASGTLVLAGEDKPCLPATLEITSPKQARLILTEGKYHQVRRMLSAVGCTVMKLHRSQLGKLTLGDLAPGQWREVRVDEI